MTNKMITVKNAEGDPDTKAEIVIQNQIDFEPKVSVIIPVYNVEEYLRQCMDSVVNQTLKEIEIICVDDGSTDSSLKILKEYAAKDKRITVIKQENLHAGVARNAGLTVAKGEYVHFLDSDDWVDLDTYEKLYKIIANKKVNFVKFKSYSFDNQTKQIVKNGYTDMKRLKRSRYISLSKDTKKAIGMSDAPWSGIYKYDFINSNNIRFDNLICANDVGFYFRCLIKAGDFYFINKKFVYYRINNQKSLVSIRLCNFGCQIKLFYIIKEISKNENVSLITRLDRRFAHEIAWRYKFYMQNSDISDELKHDIQKQTLSFFANHAELKSIYDEAMKAPGKKKRKFGIAKLKNFLSRVLCRNIVNKENAT